MPILGGEKNFYVDNFAKTVVATVLFLSTYYLLLPALPLHFQALGANKFEIGLIMGCFSVSSLLLRPRQSLILYPTLILFCGLISFGVISVMLPLFAQSQGIAHIENFFVIHTLTVIATRLFTGRLDQKYLPHLVIGSLILLIISLVLMSFVQTMEQLLLVAVIYGVGYGAIYPALSALVVLLTPMTQRGAALGFFTAAFDLGASAGTMLGGLSEFFGFQAVYLFGALLPFLGLLLFTFLYLPLLKQAYQKASA